MDMIIGIFQKLGVDQSVFYQFAIFIVLFAALKSVFFNKLLFVIQTRESKTTKLESEAGDKFKEADKLSEKFDSEIQKASEDAHKEMSEVKNNSLKKIMDEQKSKEAKVLTNYEEQKKAVVAEVSAQRDAVLQSSKELSENLVNKLVN